MPPVPLAADEIARRLEEFPGWQHAENAIKKRYSFGSFREAIAFVDRVAAIAEELNHHPDILVEYDKVTLTLSSHDAGGITARDFRLAQRIAT